MIEKNICFDMLKKIMNWSKSIFKCHFNDERYPTRRGITTYFISMFFKDFADNTGRKRMQNVFHAAFKFVHAYNPMSGP